MVSSSSCISKTSHSSFSGNKTAICSRFVLQLFDISSSLHITAYYFDFVDIMITRDPNDLPYEAYQNISLREQHMADAMFAEALELKLKSSQIEIINNTSASYRDDKDEKLLFVNEEPRRLTPGESIGYSVRWNKRKGEHQIKSLLSGNQRAICPESLDICSQHNLCVPCLHLLNAFCQHDRSKKEKNDPTEANVVIWHSCIASIIVSVKCHRCFLCSMVMEKQLSPAFPSLLRNPDGLTHFRIEVCWDVSGNAKGMKKVYFAAIDSRKPRHPSSNYFFFYLMCAWPDSIAAAFFNPREGRDTGTHLQTDDKDEKRQLASYWIENCVSDVSGSHHACAGDDVDFIPSRLLDVNFATQSGRLRLIHQGQEDDQVPQGARYCTLSHCWGKDGSKSIPLLQKSNINYRSSVGMHMKELPQTFQDAVEVCSWFQSTRMSTNRSYMLT